jgi:hypothetical protein
MGEPPHTAVQAFGRWVARAVALVSGAFALGLTVFLASRAASGAPVGPRETLSIILYLTFFAFVISGAFTWWIEYSRRKELEREIKAPTAIEAAKARQELLELRKRVAPRTFTDRSAVVRELRPVKGNIDIFYLSGHAEAFHFAAELKETLEAAGWTVNRLDDAGGSVGFGIEISVRDSTNPPERARVLKMLLEGEGFAVAYDQGNPVRPPDSLALFVGDKP